MTCERPFKIWLPKEHSIYRFADYYESQMKKASMTPKPNHYSIQIPCRHCLGCRLDLANDWATKIYCETITSTNAMFLTLTYDPEHVPTMEDGTLTLRYRDAQRFLHDLRQKHPEIRISYVISGEYGSKGTHRPHYHLALFGYYPKDCKFYKYSKANSMMKLYKSKEIHEIWKKGICIIGRLEYGSACYIARYVQKKAGLYNKFYKYEEKKVPNEKAPTIAECAHYIHNYLEQYTDSKAIRKEYAKTRYRTKKTRTKQTNKEDEFIHASTRPAIGLKYWNIFKEKIKRNSGIWINYNGHIKKKPIPKLFQKKWKEENPEEYYRWAWQNINQAKETLKIKISKIDLPNKTDYEKEVFLRKQTAEFLRNAGKKLSRDNFV